jgi:valyl-tRNA synthetase
MHVGNAWGKVLKDCLLRYHRLRGRDVRARPGYTPGHEWINTQIDYFRSIRLLPPGQGTIMLSGSCPGVYDTHGLPVEVNVEERHEFESKAAIEEYGVDRFVTECREYVDEQVVNTCPRCETAVSDSRLEYEVASRTLPVPSPARTSTAMAARQCSRRSGRPTRYWRLRPTPTSTRGARAVTRTCSFAPPSSGSSVFGT